MELNTALNLPENTDIYEFATQITEEIMAHYEKPLLKKIAESEFPHSSPVERMEIVSLAISHADGNSLDVMDAIHYERRRALIEEKALDFLKENGSIIINGFVNFRLGEYKDELRNLCHDAAEEIYAMREYDEFMNMLRFFVSVQAPKENTVYIKNSGGVLKIYNKRHRDITDFYCEESVFSDEGFTREDIILSALITIAPRKIVIHGKRESERIYDTISNVFSNVEFTE